MPAIKFRTTDYSAVSGISYSELSPNAISFFGDRKDLSIQVNTYSEIANVVDANSLKRIKSTTNVKRINNSSGLVLNDYLNYLELPLNKIPNWASTISINFGDASGVSAFDVTSAKVTASGAGLYLSPFEESLATGAIEINLFEICHTDPSTSAVGSGSSAWSFVDHQSKATTFSLTRNPGPSGVYAKIGSTGIPSKVHDWHLGMCVRPKQINTTPFIAFSCIVEYL